MHQMKKTIETKMLAMLGISKAGPPIPATITHARLLTSAQLEAVAHTQEPRAPEGPVASEHAFPAVA